MDESKGKRVINLTDFETFRENINDKFDSFEKLISTGINSLKDLFKQNTEVNEKAHDDMKGELKYLRENDVKIFEENKKNVKEIDVKISKVRTDLEEQIKANSDEIGNLKLKPGQNASELMKKIGGIVLTLIIGAAFTALIFWLSNGAPGQ